MPETKPVAGGWDVIVVGAGSAGAALARRAFDRGRKVLLLEAGLDLRSADIPDVWRSPNPWRALFGAPDEPNLIWPKLMATRTDAQAPALYWRGLGVGGSSLINGQIAIRPPMEEFDDWSVPGWSRDDVAVAFNRLETDEEFGAERFHGDSGPIPIFRTAREDWGPVDRALAESGVARGFPWEADVNKPGATGVSPYPINSREGKRVTSSDGYLEAVRGRDGLSILGRATVDRVIFDGTEAVGVRAIVNGEPRKFFGNEIVLCAGAVHTPAILVRSGVGPANRLRQLDIDVIASLPVGEGFQDHAMIALSTVMGSNLAGTTPDDRHTNVTIRTTSAVKGAPFNDLMFVSMNRSVLAMEYADSAMGHGGFGVWLNGVSSRGQVIIDSPDPNVQPFVRENMLSTRDDLDRMTAGVRELIALGRCAEGAGMLSESLERANRELMSAIDSADQTVIDGFLRATAVDAQHGSGTCRIGDPSDTRSVVDSGCAVLGTTRLRIADASIFPTVPRANTHLIATMVGERVADILFSDID